MSTSQNDQRILRKRVRSEARPQQNNHLNESQLIHRALPARTPQRALQDPASLQEADVLDLQRTIGNRAVARLLSAQPCAPTCGAPNVEAKSSSGLTVGPANDAH